MIKNVHLGFFINEYNKMPIWTELASFKDANELDRFMEVFLNNNEKIRKQFSQDISEYSIDNIGQFRKVEEITKSNFRGRISAYYINENGKMEFLELSTPKKKQIRDFRVIPTFEEAFEYLSKVFNEAVEKINDRYKPNKPPKEIFTHFISEKLLQVSYEVSDEEKRYLKIYYDHQNEQNKKGCLTLLRTNLRRHYLKKEQERKLVKIDKPKESTSDEEFERLHIVTDLYELTNELAAPNDDKLTHLEGSSNELQYNIEKTEETGDYDHLYSNHDLDELIRDTNIGRGKKQ